MSLILNSYRTHFGGNLRTLFYDSEEESEEIERIEIIRENERKYIDKKKMKLEKKIKTYKNQNKIFTYNIDEYYKKLQNKKPTTIRSRNKSSDSLNSYISDEKLLNLIIKKDINHINKTQNNNDETKEDEKSGITYSKKDLPELIRNNQQILNNIIEDNNSKREFQKINERGKSNGSFFLTNFLTNNANLKILPKINNNNKNNFINNSNKNNINKDKDKFNLLNNSPSNNYKSFKLEKKALNKNSINNNDNTLNNNRSSFSPNFKKKLTLKNRSLIMNNLQNYKESFNNIQNTLNLNTNNSINKTSSNKNLIQNLKRQQTFDINPEDVMFDNLPEIDVKNDFLNVFKTESEISNNPFRALLKTPPKRKDKRRKIFDEIYNIDDKYISKLNNTKKLKKSLNLLDYQNELVKIVALRMSVDNIKKLSIQMRDVRDLADKIYPNKIEWEELDSKLQQFEINRNAIMNKRSQSIAENINPTFNPSKNKSRQILKMDKLRINKLENSDNFKNNWGVDNGNYGGISIITPSKVLSNNNTETNSILVNESRKRHGSHSVRPDSRLSKMQNLIPEYLIEKFKNLKVLS